MTQEIQKTEEYARKVHLLGGQLILPNGRRIRHELKVRGLVFLVAAVAIPLGMKALEGAANYFVSAYHGESAIPIPALQATKYIAEYFTSSGEALSEPEEQPREPIRFPPWTYFAAPVLGGLGALSKVRNDIDTENLSLKRIRFGSLFSYLPPGSSN